MHRSQSEIFFSSAPSRVRPTNPITTAAAEFPECLSFDPARAKKNKERYKSRGRGEKGEEEAEAKKYLEQ